MSKSPKITREQLERYHGLRQAKREAERRARANDAELKQLEKTFRDALDAAGQTTCKRGAYRVSVIDGRPVVSWKDEFVRVTSAEVAEQILADAPLSQRIEVTQETR